jgi:glycyl-tRNA synthetase
MIDAYEEETLEDGSSRTVMQLHPALAPFKAAVLPLSKKLSNEARAVFEDLAKYFMIDYDDAGSIGKRYRRHDEIGTPFCITFDFDSLEDNQVTIRNRDTMEQKRVAISDLKNIIEEATQF